MDKVSKKIGMKKNIILLDLDRTLFDTDRFKRDLFHAAKELGVPVRRAKEISSGRFVREEFHQGKYARALFREKKLQRSFLNKCDALFHKAEEYWYDGALDFLKRLKKRHQLFLLSYGDPAYQLKKIPKNLAVLFDQIIITREEAKLKELLQLKKEHPIARFLLLDDSRMAIASARQAGVAALRVKSGPKKRECFETICTKILSKI